MRLALVVFAVLGTAAVWAYHDHLLPTLPPEIPAHFNAAGLPDRYASKENLVGLCWIDSLLTLLFVGLSFFTVFLGRVAPGFVNLPGKEKLADLPPEARARAIEPLGIAFAWLALAEHGLFGYLLWAIAEIALKRRDALSQAPLAAVMAVVIGTLVVATAASGRAIAREVGRASAAHRPS